MTEILVWVVILFWIVTPIVLVVGLFFLIRGWGDALAIRFGNIPAEMNAWSVANMTEQQCRDHYGDAAVTRYINEYNQGFH